jgi:hypothetical protein
MGCASAIGKSSPSRSQMTRNATANLSCGIEEFWTVSAQFSALLQCLQNLVGCRKVVTVPANPVKLRTAAVNHVLIQVRLTASLS